VKLAVGISATLVFRVVGMALGYALTFLIARFYGSEGVGEYNLLLQIILTSSSFLMVGLNTAVLRFSGEFKTDQDFSRHRKLVSQYLTILVTTSIIFICLFATLTQVFHFQLFNLTRLTSLLLLLGIPAFAINAVNVEMIRGLGKLKYSEFLRSVLRPMTIGGLILFGTISANLTSLVGAISLGIASTLILSSSAVIRALRFRLGDWKFSARSFSLLKTSWPMMITNIANTLLVALPILYLNQKSELAEVGLFSVSLKLSQFVALSLIIVNTVCAPQFANYFWNDNKRELTTLVSQSVRAVAALAIAVALPLIIGGRSILEILGKEFDDAYTLLVILTGSQLINALTGSSGVLLNMVGGQQILSKNIVIGLCVMSLAFILVKPNLQETTYIYALSTVGINVANAISLRHKYSIKSYLS